MMIVIGVALVLFTMMTSRKTEPIGVGYFFFLLGLAMILVGLFGIILE